LLLGALPLGALALLALPAFVGALLLRCTGALLLCCTGALLLCGTRALLLLCGTSTLLLLSGALTGCSTLLHGAALLVLLGSVGTLRRALGGALRRLGAGLGRGLRRRHALLRCGAHAWRRRLVSSAASAARAALSATGLALGTLSGGKTCPSD
jgi:hypothetical protein